MDKKFIYYDTTGVILRNDLNDKIMKALVSDLKEYNKTSPDKVVRINFLKGRICTILGNMLEKGYYINEELCSCGVKEFIKDNFSFIDEVEPAKNESELLTGIYKFKILYDFNLKMIKDIGRDLLISLKDNKVIVTLSNGVSYVYNKAVNIKDSVCEKLNDLYLDLKIWIKLNIL